MGADPAGDHTATPTAPARRSELVLRILSALVLAPLALAAAYFDGWLFAAFWAAAAVAVFCEWMALVAAPEHRLAAVAGSVALCLAALALMLGRADAALACIGLGAVAAAAAAPAALRLWSAAGFVYAAAMLLAVLLLRADAASGLGAVLFLFAVVWGTDVAAYFVGRTLGGPKLWPRLSPKKTWSGALGGAAAAMLAGIATAALVGTGMVALAVVAIVLSAAAQLGDLMESAMKRRFGVKDSGHLIPGHGGFMDRLDGFMAAVVVAAVIGLGRGGLGTPAQGLLAW